MGLIKIFIMSLIALGFINSFIRSDFLNIFFMRSASHPPLRPFAKSYKLAGLQNFAIVIQRTAPALCRLCKNVFFFFCYKAKALEPLQQLLALDLT